MVGVDGATVLDDMYLANEKGLLLGTAFCTAMTDQVGGARDLGVCCGTCHQLVEGGGAKVVEQGRRGRMPRLGRAVRRRLGKRPELVQAWKLFESKQVMA